MKRYRIVSYAGWVVLELTASSRYEALTLSGFGGPGKPTRATVEEIKS